MVTNDTRALMETAGFTTESFNEGKHLKFTGHGLRLTHWPRLSKWMFAGLVFRVPAEAVLRAVEGGRFQVTGDHVPCKYCNADIVWVQTDNEKWIPVEADGDSHFGRCKGQRS